MHGILRNEVLHLMKCIYLFHYLMFLVENEIDQDCPH